jgi:leader peptidase (prepilin peptidase) / N-methyltransferase
VRFAKPAFGGPAPLTQPGQASNCCGVNIIEAYSIAWVALGAVIGAVLGSFINCARYRLPRGISLIRPSYSYCPSCNSRLTALDLVPIFSWLCLGGRCRYCRAPIGIGSLVVELCCATIGALLVFWFVAH